MRLICTYFGLLSASFLNSAGVYAATMVNNAQKPPIKVVHGLSNAQGFQAPSDGKFYVQVGTFNSAKNAENYKRELADKFHQPVQVKTQGKYHLVVVGPLHSAAEVRALGGSPEVQKPVIQTVKPVTQSVKAYHIPDRDGLLEPTVVLDHYEIIGALGVANLLVDDSSSFRVTNFEIDRLIPNNNSWNTVSAQIGAGYVHYFGEALPYSAVQWFPWIEPQINIYYLGNSTIDGDVWRFESPEFNDLTFSSSLQSTRLMFDTSLTIVSKDQYSLYTIGGIGYAWNHMDYKDTTNESGCSFINLNLNTGTHSNFAWEVGAGLMYNYNPSAAFSLQYLYTDLGNAHTSSGSLGGVASVVDAPHFDLSAQTVSLGLHLSV
ncbi:MAG: SPOR domain-containing protein [Legionella sp.]|nr:SPOR domain-containing protein [Legionella sp.]